MRDGLAGAVATWSGACWTAFRCICGACPPPTHGPAAPVASSPAYEQPILACIEAGSLQASYMLLRDLRLADPNVMLALATDRDQDEIWFLCYMLFAVERVIQTDHSHAGSDPRTSLAVQRFLRENRGLLALVWPTWHFFFDPPLDQLVRAVLRPPPLSSASRRYWTAKGLLPTARA